MLLDKPTKLVSINLTKGFEQLIALVTHGKAANTQRKYDRYLRDFIDWYLTSGYGDLNKATVQAYFEHLRSANIGSLNLRMSAIKSFVRELADNGLVEPALSLGVQNIRSNSVKKKGERLGNWLDRDSAQRMLFAPDTNTLKGLRDRAILAVALGCGLRRSEIVSLTLKHIQVRDGRALIVDLVGKGDKLRTVPIPRFVELALRQWIEKAELSDGFIFRRIHKSGAVQNDGITAQALYDVIKEYAPAEIAPHDLRRSFAKLTRQAGGDLLQLSLILGHSSAQTTERYIGERLDLRNAPNDLIDLHLI